jgi:signal transduction histidine kinase/ligand-binding sensor domain-containing protein
MSRLVFIGFFWCGLIQGLFSQDYHYSTRNYTAVDGLPQSQIVGLLEDNKGYLWMGTFGGGITRFDGREFKTYTTRDGLLSNDIRSLLLDHNDNIWILHPRGVSRFDGLKFKKFDALDSTGAKVGFRQMYHKEDTVFLLSEAGTIAKIYSDSLYVKPNNTAGNKKFIWFHLMEMGQTCFITSDGSCLIQTSTQEFLIDPEFELGKRFNIFNWKSKTILQTVKGLFEVDMQTRKLKKTSVGFMLENYVMLYDDKRDVFWTLQGATLLKETFRAGVLKRDTVLRDIGINQVLIDAEENTWIATDGHGLYKYFIQDFDRLGNADGVMAILKSNDGARWIGTMTKGLSRIKNGKVDSYVDSKRPGRNSVHVIKQAPDGTIWTGTSGGLGKYNGVTNSFDWVTPKDSIPLYSVMSLDFDDKGGLWSGSRKGLVYLNKTTERRFTAKDGLRDDFAWCVTYSKNHKTLFIGLDDGIQKIENGKVKDVKIKGFDNTCVISMNTYRDSLIVGGTGGAGLLIFNPVTLQRWFITMHEGLASDFIYFVTPDEKDYLWIGTEKGINRIKLNAACEIIENLHYGYDNGLLGVETNQNSYYFTNDEKYVGLVDGLYRFNDLGRKKKNSIDLHLTDLQILYGEYSARAYADSVYSFFKIPFKPSFPTDKNHITFYFNRVDKTHPKSVKFKYYLENFDKAWSPPSSTGQVTYGNLPPGDYNFRVMATDDQGSWSKASITYPFTVLSPFYMRASFIVGMFILIAGIITLVLYIRVKQRIRKAILMERIRTKEQESLRKEIARDFHDEMGNQLTRIINYISLLKLNGQSGYSREELYSKVENSAKYLYTGTRDFIWSIDPVNDELCKLFIHIRDFGETLFEEKSIEFRAFNEIREKIKLPYGFSREANLIFKEAMTNAFKYSQAKNATFSLVRNNDYFEMVFEDDGIGFNISDLENLNGLKNISERNDRLGSILRISSEVNKGTKIILHFTLTKTPKYGFTL